MVDASCQPQKRAGSGARDLCDFMRQNEMDRWTGSGSDLLMNVDRVELRLERCCVFVWKTIKGGPPLSAQQAVDCSRRKRREFRPV